MTACPIACHPMLCSTQVEDLPDEVLVYLLGSRYCETDRLSDTAWSLFGHIPPGWARVQAIVAFTHEHIEFGYHFARPTKTAWDSYQERQGVCRDYAHLAVALCRCMNIPARYCTGYLGDIGMPPPYAAGDFSAWFDVYSKRRVAHVRCAPQHAAHRPHPDGAWARRNRYRADDDVRPGAAGRLQRDHRRNSRADAAL